jgi:hypothetical protein
MYELFYRRSHILDSQNRSWNVRKKIRSKKVRILCTILAIINVRIALNGKIGLLNSKRECCNYKSNSSSKNKNYLKLWGNKS